MQIIPPIVLGDLLCYVFELIDRSFQDLKVCGVDHEKPRKKSQAVSYHHHL